MDLSLTVRARCAVCTLKGGCRANTELEESIATTGAVVMGRRTYQMGEADSYAESYGFQVPIFVLTHTVPKPSEKGDGSWQRLLSQRTNRQHPNWTVRLSIRDGKRE